MSEQICEETRTMAKVQKSIQFPVDVYRLIEELESRYGAKVNRQALAAFLQFMFTRPEGPDTRWIRMAVMLEKGAIGLPDVPVMVAEEEMKEAQEQKERWIKHGPAASVTDWAHQDFSKKRSAWRAWQRIAADGQKPTVEDITAHWRKTDAQLGLQRPNGAEAPAPRKGKKGKSPTDQ